MKKLIFKLMSLMITMVCLASCSEPLMFADTGSPAIPQLKNGSAQLLWIGSEYKVVVQGTLEDSEGISKINLRNGEWQINSDIIVDNKTSYIINQTYTVPKDVNSTKHTIELTVTNKKGGIVKASIAVEDLSATNQVPGYNPDLLPPVITVTKPTVTTFYGLSNDPITIELAAGIADAVKIASVEIKVWGETADGQLVNQEETVTPATAQQINYQYAKSFSLPAGKVGEYQYLVKAIDASGNKAVKSGVITVGYMDRLYLSDAETEAEVLNQGYDNGGPARGFGTLLSMKKQGSNSFVVDYYYRNEASDNIRFVAFQGTARPFTANMATPTYTLTSPNVLGHSKVENGKITPVLADANFKLPVANKGYYRITVDMTKRTITAVPFTPTKPFVDATKYPGWTADPSKQYPYLSVISSVVVGTAGWAETATSPKLMKEADHAFLYTGTFKTSGSSVNVNFMAPKAVLGANNGWFRLVNSRANMKDDYGDMIDIVGAVGVSTAGTNYGFSHNTAGTFKATYDMALERLRLIRTGN